MIVNLHIPKIWEVFSFTLFLLLAQHPIDSREETGGKELIFFPPKEQEKQVKMGNAEDAYSQLSFCSKPSRGLRALAQKQILKSFGGS